MTVPSENTPLGMTVLVVGGGPVGVHMTKELLRRSDGVRVVFYDADPWGPYNRIRLTPLLTGEADWIGVGNPLPEADDERLIQRLNCRVTHIDRETKQVVDQYGHIQPYDRLVLALGSDPHVPGIPGIERSGVFTFRDMADAQKLAARKVRTRHTVVIGGGLLGLEAARGMQGLNTRVTVIEQGGNLMNRQLDSEGGGFLKRRIEHMGIECILGEAVTEIVGTDRVEGVRLRSGQVVECDTVVVSAGIKPRIKLAREAGLSVGRAIRVDDHMRTSDPNVYAVGECAEHRQVVYGLVAPGLEQAAVASHNILGGKSIYQGTVAATKLKVAGETVFSIGESGSNRPDATFDYLAFRSDSGGVYRRLTLWRGRVEGVMAVGDWPELNRIQDAVLNRQRLWPWQQWRFKNQGHIWPDQTATSVADWPSNVTVCNCTGVTRGDLGVVLAHGVASVDQLAAMTGASSVCGSCKPLLNDLVGSAATAEPVKGARWLTLFSAVALIGALATLLLAPVPLADSVQDWRYALDSIWRDGVLKQFSGYGLLGLTVVAATLSLRKRYLPKLPGGYDGWRLVHTLIGVLIVVTLFLHTGFRVGINLNQFLLVSFVIALLFGAASASSIAASHRLTPLWGRRVRSALTWVHILVLWPLPVLLGFHILSVYYF
ncbi:MAG: FAD-dependent oxidoreductase [Pseudomonadota bacterium]|nr:FAD-dependent oxidoreductase [Pseudomonadota bacterium]